MPATYTPTAIAPTTGDNTARLNAALAACTPGDAVQLRSGVYRCDGPLTIPNGVGLIGSWPTACNYFPGNADAITNPSTYGCVIQNNWTTSATGESDPPFLTLGSNATLRGVGLWDTKQGIPGTSQVARPYQIGTLYGPSSAASAYSGNGGVTIRDVAVINGDKGLRLWGAYEFDVRDVRIGAITRGVSVDQAWDTATLSRVKVVPLTWFGADGNIAASVTNYTTANLDCFTFAHVDGMQCSDLMAIWGRTGILLRSTTLATNPSKPWVAFTNTCIDLCDIGIDCQASQDQGVQFTGGSITTPATSASNIGVRTGAGNVDLAISNMSICSQSGKEVRHGGGFLTLSACKLWSNGVAASGSSPSILGTAGNLIASGCRYADSRPTISWQYNGGSFQAPSAGVVDPYTRRVS